MSDLPDRVTFAYPESGHTEDQRKAGAYLRRGVTYTVEHVNVQGWSTTYELVEFPGVRFNAAMFNP